MKELDNLYHKVSNEVSEIQNAIRKRMSELITIAEENGITDFGWKNGYDEDDEDFDYDEFSEAKFNFILEDDFVYQTGEISITRFRVEDGRIYGREYYDDQDDQLIEDAYVRFSYCDDRNWRAGYWLIQLLEKELKEAGVEV